MKHHPLFRVRMCPSNRPLASMAFMTPAEQEAARTRQALGRTQSKDSGRADLKLKKF